MKKTIFRLLCASLCLPLLFGSCGTPASDEKEPADSAESAPIETAETAETADEPQYKWMTNEPGVYEGEVEGIDFVMNIESGKDIEILQLSDPQICSVETTRNETRHSDFKGFLSDEPMEEQFCKYARTVFEHSDPDLIVLCGDLVYGEMDDSGEHLLALIEFMDSLETPWALCFGNHDNESQKGVMWQIEQFENSKYCVFKQGSVTGNSNYNIVFRQDGEIKYSAYLIDTHGCKVLDRGAGILEDNPDFDIACISSGIYDDQIEWFVESNKAIQTLAGRETVPNVVFQHISPNAMHLALNEKYQPKDLSAVLRLRQEGDFGYMTQGIKVNGGVDKDGTFDQACRENGTLGIFCGHNHNNDASIEWNGMRYTYGSKSSTYDSYTGTMLGGTQIFLDAEESGLSVAHLKYVQLMKDTNEQ